MLYIKLSKNQLRKAVASALAAALLTLAFVPAALAQEGAGPVTMREAPPDATTFRLELVAGGFTRPLGLTNAGDDSGRLFLLEQGGVVHIIEGGEVLPQPFLDVSSLLPDDARGGGYSERGLMGMVFHPNYAENGRFFIHYTDQLGTSVIAEYRVSADPNTADPASERQLLRVDHPYRNHNGGQLAFGPDGYLYIAMGDGGSANDPLGHGQNPFSLLGTIMRIDVDNVAGNEPYSIPESNPFADGVDALPEIWAIGLRNPWRFSFDRATGDLYIADVGQNAWEEINFVAAGDRGGMNFGWNAYEGAHRLSGGAEPSPDMVPPVVEYGHGEGCSVTGGYVYRGEAIPELEGVYLYGDWCTGFVWGAYRDAAGAWQSVRLMQTQRSITSFGEDEQGELYLVDDGGRGDNQGSVLRFVPSDSGS